MISETNLSEHIHHHDTVILCKPSKTLLKKISDIAAEISFSLIIVSESTPINLSSSIKTCYLPTAFSNYAFQQALNQSAAVENHAELPITVERLIGKSDQIKKIRSIISQVAESDSSVLILGKSGVGKDVVASCIHQCSGRKANPFIPINCGAIPSDLIESELFGHEKGAFTGALARRTGRIEIANKGTLFLDEIGDMPLMMQVKLLRVLQEKSFERVGGTSNIPVDFRLIAATHKDLSHMITENTFREDLFYRINVFPIHVPSLQERHEDIPDLIEHYVEKIALRLHHRVAFTQEALDMLCAYAWPGNIRELQNFVERMVILHPDQIVGINHIELIYHARGSSAPALPGSTPFNIKQYIETVEKNLIESALKHTNGMAHLAAEYLSMGKKTLVEKIKKYGLVSENT
jgi:sigma-54 specific flagellar transcriptional regulator A